MMAMERGRLILSLTCVKCGFQGKVPEKCTGKKVRCKKCANLITVQMDEWIFSENTKEIPQLVTVEPIITRNQLADNYSENQQSKSTGWFDDILRGSLISGAILLGLFLVSIFILVIFFRSSAVAPTTMSDAELKSLATEYVCLEQLKKSFTNQASRDSFELIKIWSITEGEVITVYITFRCLTIHGVMEKATVSITVEPGKKNKLGIINHGQG
jgi:hypothetical protein